MTNICMIAKDRPRLTGQAIRSLVESTPAELYNLTVVDDASTEQYRTRDNESVIPEDWLDECRSDGLCVRLSHSKGIVGFVRNVSIGLSEAYWGRGDFLYLSDNDMYFQPGWLEAMTQTLTNYERRCNLKVLGGVRHPFHGINDTLFQFPFKNVAITDAVAGYSYLMRWDTFYKYGPFDAHAQGVCQSEDFAFCQKIVKDGGYVGYIDPPVLINCGLTNSEGKPAVGSEAFPRHPEIIQE